MKRFCPLLLAALLSGCALLEPAAPEPEPDPLPEPAEAVPPAEAAPPPPEPPSEAVLMGMRPAQVQDLLGPPSLVRRENVVQVMQFAAETCVLDVTLYEEAPGAPFRVQHVQARRRGGEALAPKDCLALLIPEERWADPFGGSE